MHDFHDKLAEGHAHERFLDEWFRRWFDIEPATLDEDRRLGVDRWFTSRETGQRFGVQYKADSRAGETGNAFVETVSNDRTGTPGWVHTCKADYILYYIVGWELVYVLEPAELRRRLYGWKARYREVTVANKGYQTHGLLVPLDELEKCAHVTVTS